MSTCCAIGHWPNDNDFHGATGVIDMTKEQAGYVYITRFPDQLYLSVRCPLCTVLNADWIGKWDGSNTAIKTTVILSISVQLSKKSIVAISFFDQICAKYHICSLVMQTTNSHHRIFTARSCISMSIYAKFIQHYPDKIHARPNIFAPS